MQNTPKYELGPAGFLARFSVSVLARQDRDSHLVLDQDREVETETNVLNIFEPNKII